MAIVNFAEVLRNARAQAVIDTLDAGADGVTTTAMMHFYTGPKPAAGAAITTEVLVGSCALAEPSGTVATGILTFNPISDDVSADADDDIAWCRVVDSDGGWVIDLDCGEAASGAAIIFNTVTARIGGVIKILSASFTEGNS